MAIVELKGRGPGDAESRGKVGGVLWMMLAIAVFTIMQLFIKTLATEMPVAVLVLWRMIFGLGFAFPWLTRQGLGEMRTRHPYLQFWRGALGMGAMACFAYSLAYLIFSDAVALAFTSPLWSIVLSVLFLGEAVRIRRWSAAALGFVGVLAIVKPHDAVDPIMLVALLGALLGSAVMIVLRKLAVVESGAKISFYSHLVGGLLVALPAVLSWQTPTSLQFVLLLLIGLCSSLGQLCYSRAFALGEVTFVAPFEFLRLPMAALLGLLLFAELPDSLALAGMALIGGACVYIARREAELRWRVAESEQITPD